MNVFQTITRKASEAGLPFLVIGGYAVMAHGVVRSTEDLDLPVRGSQRARGRELLEGAGLTVPHERGNDVAFVTLIWPFLALDFVSQTLDF